MTRSQSNTSSCPSVSPEVSGWVHRSAVRRAAPVLLALGLSACHDFGQGVDDCVARGACPGSAAPKVGLLTIDPTSKDFGARPLTVPLATTFTVTNAGDAASGALTVALSGADVARFAVESNACDGHTLDPLATCTFDVAFTPDALAPVAAVVTVSATSAPAATATLAGAGSPPPAVAADPADLDFAEVLAGTQSAAQQVTVRNPAAVASPTLTSTFTGADAARFHRGARDGCTGTSLAPGAQCTVDLVFAPVDAGVAAAAFEVSAGTQGTARVSLSGTGTVPPPGSLSATPVVVNFQLTAVGSASSPRGFVVQNTGPGPTGPLAVALSGPNAASFTRGPVDTCTGKTLAPQATCAVVYVWRPASTAAELATATVTGTPGGEVQVTLTSAQVTPPVYTASPAQLAFGTIPQGSSASRSVTVTNSGGRSATAIGPSSLTGPDAASFSISFDGCASQRPSTGGACSVVVAFAPTALAAKTATLVLGETSATPSSLPVTGTGALPSALSLSGTLGFGSVLLGAPGTRVLTLTNSGGVTSGPVTPAISVTDPAEVSLTADTCSNATLDAGASCAVTVRLAPTLAGVKSGTVSFSASPGGTASAALNAVAVAPVTVTKLGLGTGSITSTPAGLSCSATCTVNLGEPGVTLLATPAPFTNFSGFTGCDSQPSPNECALTLDGGRVVTARFDGVCSDGPCPVSLSVVRKGGAAGVIRYADGGLACASGTCVLSLDAGAVLSFVAAVTDAGVGFEGWDGGGCGLGAGCAFTVAGATSALANFAPFNRVFVTSLKVTGATLGGLAGADAVCGSLARDAGLPGNFVAFLPTGAVDAVGRLNGARGFVRPDGLPFLDVLANGQPTHVYYPPRLTERGLDLVDAGYQVNIYQEEYTLTGAYTGSTATTTCGDWTSDSGTTMVGSATSGDGQWASYQGAMVSCTTPAHLYCFGTDYRAQMPGPSATGRFAFQALGNFVVSSGVPAADALCSADATDAGLPGTYRALLAVGTSPYGTRFVGGTQWVRTDGTVFVKDPANFLIQKALPVAPLDVNARGQVVGYPNLVWTGQDQGLPVSAGRNCNAWTTTSSAAAAALGDTLNTSTSWLTAYATSCSATPPAGVAWSVYCLQQ